MSRCEYVGQARITYDELDRDYDERKKRTDSLRKKMEAEVRQDKHERGCNWFGIVDYEFAHCRDGFKAKKIDPCPFCLGKKEIVFFDKNSPATGFKSMGDCGICKGSGVAWFKYGLFEIERDSGVIC